MVILSTLFMGALLPLATLAQNPQTFSVSFWSGTHCSGSETGFKEGPADFARRRYCYDIPELGVTQAFDFYAAEDDFRIQLHKDRSCTDVTGFGYEGRPDVPVCLRTNIVSGAVAYSVYRNSAVNGRSIGERSRAKQSLELAPAIATPRGNPGEVMSPVEKRAVDSFLLTGVIGGFTFAIAAAEYCPRTYDPNKNKAANYAPCAISATATVVTAVLTGIGYSGEESSQDKSNGKVRRSLFDLDVLPVLDKTSVPGYTISMAKQASRIDDVGEEWNSLIMDIVHDESGSTSQATYEHHNASDTHKVSSPHTGSSDSTLESRNTNYYAYYAWTQTAQSTFRERATGTNSVNQLTSQLWNYGRSHDAGVFCANFAVFGTRANTGQFAITNGVFAPDFSKC